MLQRGYYPLKQIQNFTIKCFAKASDVLLTVTDETPVQEDQAVPGTSGVSSTVTRTITVYESDDPDSPEPLHFGTENQAYLECELHVSYSGENLPDLGDTMEPDVEDMELTLKYDSSDTEATALTAFTTFRALNEKEKIMTEKNEKFKRLEKASTDSENGED